MATFEQIQKANEQIQTMDFKGRSYATVNERIKAFRMLYPTGFVTTEILSLEDGVVTMKATVGFYDLTGTKIILGTGHAQEKESSSYINKTSFIENCETSAWGRAMSACGLGIDTSVASYEEVANAVKNQEKATKEQIEYILDNLSESALRRAVDKYGDIEDMPYDAAVKTILSINKKKGAIHEEA